MKRYSLNDMKSIAKSRHGSCLSKSYISIHQHLRWKCKNGHKWEATPNNVIRGTWCKICRNKQSGQKRLNSLALIEAKSLARSRKGACLSKEYQGALKKLKWRCEEDHVWDAVIGNVRKGSWCPECGGTRKKSIQDLIILVKKKNGRLLESKFKSVKSIVNLECQASHRWKTSASNIFAGSWCPSCGKKQAADARRTLRLELKAMAAKRGGHNLSEYTKSREKVLWKCAENHVFKMQPSEVKSGRWCPECSSGFGERLCRLYFEKIFNSKFPKAHPQWLKISDRVQLELDGYSEELGIAFEHQGRHHYEQNTFYHSNMNLKTRKKYDRLKKLRCTKNDVVLIRIPEVGSITKIDTLKELILSQAEKHGVSSSVFNSNFEVIDLKQAYLNPHREKLRFLKKIALSKGGVLVSEFYTGVHDKLLWSCAEGHSWTATPGHVSNGRWCPRCATEKSAATKRLSLADAKALAKSRGGRCLERLYKNARTRMKWSCKSGHLWEATFGSLKSGQWCPHCARRAKFTLAIMQQIAKERGGKCLSKNYKNARQKLKWQCARGHTWFAVADSVKRAGTWCRKCRHLI